MALFKFHPDDIFINTLEAHPEFSFYITSGSVYFDNTPHRQGENADVPNGFVSLYQRNNDKAVDEIVYPFLPKDGMRVTFKKYKDSEFNAQLPEDSLTGSYNFSGSIFRDFYATNSIRPKIAALRGTLDHYKLYSPHFSFSSDSETWTKQTQEMSVVSIPSIFCGEKLKKGSVQLDYYISGTLVGTLKDENYTGELIQTAPAASEGSGSVAGVVLYNQGVIILTGSWDLATGPNSITYSGSNTTTDKWTQFGDGLHQNLSSFTHQASASFNISYQAVTHTNTMTLLAHARYGELNYSNNPTFKDYSHPNVAHALTSSYSFKESQAPPANITHTVLQDVTPELKRETYISKVSLYDKDKKLIGFAKVATPVRKTEDRQYIFKLKLDL